MNSNNFTHFRNDSEFGSVACQANWDRMAISVFCAFSIIFCLSVIGNGLVIVTVVQQRWMRTVTNLYLLNLAISDLLLSIVCMWPTFLSNFLLKCFIFGNVMCKVLAYLQPVSVTASAYTLTVIAIERYFAICRPLHSRHWQTRAHALRMILLIWAISLLSNLLHLFAYELQTTNIPGQMNCRGGVWSEQNNLIHQTVLTVVLYVLPLFIMCLLYGIMIRSLWKGIRLDRGQQMTLSSLSNGDYGSGDDIDNESCKFAVVRKFTSSIRGGVPRKIGKKQRRSADGESGSAVTDSPPLGRLMSITEQPSSKASLFGGDVALRSTHMVQALRAKERVIRMLIAVVIIFAVCWTPLYVYHLTISITITYFPKTFQYVFDWNIFVVFLTLAYSSSCTNPLLYGFLNKKFRQAFLLAFGCPSARTAMAVDLQARLLSQAQPPKSTSRMPDIKLNDSYISPVKMYRTGTGCMSDPEKLRANVETGTNWAQTNAIAENNENKLIEINLPKKETKV